MGCFAAEDITLSISSSQLPKNTYSYNRWNSKQSEQTAEKSRNYLLGTALPHRAGGDLYIRLINSTVQTVREKKVETIF